MEGEIVFSGNRTNITQADGTYNKDNINTNSNSNNNNKNWGLYIAIGTAAFSCLFLAGVIYCCCCCWKTSQAENENPEQPVSQGIPPNQDSQPYPGETPLGWPYLQDSAPEYSHSPGSNQEPSGPSPRQEHTNPEAASDGQQTNTLAFDSSDNSDNPDEMVLL
jgi:hypothetical protein